MLCGSRVSRLPPSQMPYKVAEFHGHAWNVREDATACVPGQPAPFTVTAILGRRIVLNCARLALDDQPESLKNQRHTHSHACRRADTNEPQKPAECSMEHLSDRARLSLWNVMGEHVSGSCLAGMRL